MFEQPSRPPKDTIIWRYLSLDKYLDLLVSRTSAFILALARAQG